MRWILFVILLLTPFIARAQDVTCDAGDVAWVKDTVDGDEGHTAGGTASAEYNNFAAPFGIQGAFTDACPGLEVRIVVGADQYDSTSASWTDRAADKGINVTVSGTHAAPVKIKGYIDETTPCSAWASTCPVVLDFSNTTTGDAWDAGAIYHSYEWLRLTNSSLHGLHVTTDYTVFANMEIDNHENSGIITDGDHFLFYRNRIHDNGVVNNDYQFHNDNGSVDLVEVVIYSGGTDTLSKIGARIEGGTSRIIKTAILAELPVDANLTTILHILHSTFLSDGTAGTSCLKTTRATNTMFFIGNIFADCETGIDFSGGNGQALVQPRYNYFQNVTDQFDPGAASKIVADYDDLLGNNSTLAIDCGITDADLIGNGNCVTPGWDPGITGGVDVTHPAGALWQNGSDAGGGGGGGAGSTEVPDHVIGGE